MEYLMQVLYFLMSFGVILLIHVLVINKGRETYSEGKKITEINYIVNRYKLDMRKINYNKLKWTVTIANSFIIAFTTSVLFIVKGIMWQIIIGFAVLVGLIYSVYTIIGRYYQKRGGKK